MALQNHIEWDPEEVAAGFDLSSIYEGVDDTTMAPVIFSVDLVNTTVLAGPANNISVGFSTLVKEVMEKVVAIAINATTTTPTTLVNHTVEQGPSISIPTTITTVVKKVVEHLGREPGVYNIFFVEQSLEYITVLYCTYLTVYFSTAQYYT